MKIFIPVLLRPLSLVREIRFRELICLATLTVGALCLLSPSVSHALEISYPSLPPIPGYGVGAPSTFGDLLRFLYGFVLLLSGVVIFSSIFIAGFEFLTSAANPDKRKGAKKRFAGITAGIALLFGTYLVLHTINPELINLSGQDFTICNGTSYGTGTGSPSNCPTVRAPFVLPSMPVGSGLSSPTPGTPPADVCSTCGGSGGRCCTTAEACTPGGNTLGSACAPNLTCQSDNTCAFSNNGGGGSVSGSCHTAPETTPCSPSNLTSAFGTAAINASLICGAESGGNPLALDANCLSGRSLDFSVGLFQINLIPRCPGIEQTGPSSCHITDTAALAKCAEDTYGVTFRNGDASTLIIDGADSSKQTQQAKALWSGGQSFCGNHSLDCSICYLWSTAGSGTCNICPN